MKGCALDGQHERWVVLQAAVELDVAHVVVALPSFVSLLVLARLRMNNPIAYVEVGNCSSERMLPRHSKIILWTAHCIRLHANFADDSSKMQEQMHRQILGTNDASKIGPDDPTPQRG